MLFLPEILTSPFVSNYFLPDQFKGILPVNPGASGAPLTQISSLFYSMLSESFNEKLRYEKKLLELELEILDILPLTTASQENQSGLTTIIDCFSSSLCSDIDSKKVHQREKKATEVIYTSQPVNSTHEKIANWFKSKFVSSEWTNVQEILRFRNDDPREKFLFLSAEADHNGALNPAYIPTVLSKLSHTFDLKYQVVKTLEDICKAIEIGKKINNLAYVLISGHGDRNGITLEADYFSSNGVNYQYTKNKIDSKINFEKCFSGLQANGKIILLSCSTGESNNNNNPFDNIAQKMSDSAKRVVIAPIDDVAGRLTNFLSVEDGVLYHPESLLYSYLPFYNTNLFTAFRPNFKKCTNKIDINSLHQREISAIDTIRNNLIGKSLLHKDEPIDRATEYLKLCKEDPRDKVLVLSADYDKNENGALQPKLSSKIFSVFADRFDLQYKVVKTLDDICLQINQAARFGKIITLFIQAYGTPTDGMIISKDLNGNESRIKSSDDYSKCFSKVAKDGTIVLQGSSLGQNGSHVGNIAQKISDGSQRTVLATTCRIDPKDTTIQSINPLLLKNSGFSHWGNLWERCPENNDNNFKIFNPKSTTPITHEEF